MSDGTVPRGAMGISQLTVKAMSQTDSRYDGWVVVADVCVHFLGSMAAG
jgi:hypothetical protein